MAALPELLVEALLDRYRLVHEVGRGGMAVVYLARDLRHDRDVALKVLRPELAAVLGRERFLAEIRNTAKLDHPHILTLIDSGQSGDQLWYVVPFVRGESLRQKVERERQLGLDEALLIARQVAGALDYAHRHGIIHRDVKPENILLHEGEAMLADFGIALAAREAGGERLTSTGLSLGTPQYMSPEQATAERQLDARSDVYSLGAVLYEMLAGEPPYHGTSAQAVVARMMTERPTRLRILRDTVPEVVEAAVERALAKVPADRFATAGAFAAALTGGASRARIARLPRRIGWTVIAGLGIVAGAALLFRGRTGAPPGPVTLRRFTVSGAAGEPALSPDGRRVAYVVARRSLVVQSLEGGEPVVLVPSSRFLQQPRWTQDGSAILFEMFRDSLTLAGTWMVPGAGGAARQVLDDQETFDPGPDSTVALRYQRPPHALELVELATGRIRARFPLPDTILVGFDNGLDWSPDGRLVAIGGEGIWVLRLADSSLQRIAPEGIEPRWDASGRHVFYLAGPARAVDLWRAEVQPGSGRVQGAPTRILSVPRLVHFDIGPSGQLVVQEASSTSQAYVMELRSEGRGRIEPARPLLTGSASVRDAVISDDGKRIALARELSGNAVWREAGRVSGRLVVDLIPFDGGASQPVAAGSKSQFAPSWGPGGRRLAVLRSDSGGDYVTAISLTDGSARRLSTHPAVAQFGYPGDAKWSADGSKVVYLASRQRLMLVDPDHLTETEIVIPDSIGTGFAGQVLSPHGDQVAVSTIRRLTDWGELWLVDVATRRWRRIAEPFGNSVPLRWAADGTIYVQSDRAIVGESGYALTDLWAVSADGRPPRFVGPLPDGCQRTASISADGRRVACPVSLEVSDLLLATDFMARAR